MLDQLYLKNFKSARELEVPLRPLTVLSGLNGSGKSTVLQAIGLVRQSLNLMRDDEPLSHLHLRGELVQLGTAGDVHSERAESNLIEIALVANGAQAEWSAVINNEDDDTLSVKNDRTKDECVEKLIRECHFQFLQADRLTPQTHYNRCDHNAKKWGFLGAHGQYTPDFLAEFGDRIEVNAVRRCNISTQDMPEGLAVRVVATPKLNDQICGWLQYISPGVRYDAERISNTDLVNLGFSYASSQIAQDSKRRRPSNVGFGLTYSLPIITACLAAPEGSVLLLENPEAHLHPRGQTALGNLLARCAVDGVQIIVETHSDHLLNGIRLAVKRKVVEANAVRLCYFTRDHATGDSYTELPAILPNGDLTAWPEGFFDEWEKSLEALLD